MKTSRVARETAKIGKNLEVQTRRRTRSFAASVNAFTAPDAVGSNVKREGDSDGASSLSSLVSSQSSDIEDALAPSIARKRKHGNAASATTVTATSTVEASTRTTPRKANIKTEDGTSARIKKGRKQPAKKVKNETGEVDIHPPDNWEEIYSAVEEMRERVLAPVDTMGCESLAEDTRTPRDRRFQTLIALMLSSQTKDTTTALAIRRLQTELSPPGFTLEGIIDVEPVRLNELIHAVGFHNNKTRYIKATVQILVEKFNSEIPDTIEGLISLPGVGPKMAYLCMSAAWGRDEGIGVDVHVHRITNLWGWHKTTQPEQTRASLEAWLPKEKWHEINHLLVGFGQTICLPVGRKCEDCTLSTRGLCPGAVASKKSTVKKQKKTEEAQDEDGKTTKQEVLAKQEVV